jgi:hypothetical protein
LPNQNRAFIRPGIHDDSSRKPRRHPFNLPPTSMAFRTSARP